MCSKSGHLPCISVSSKASLQAATGEDCVVGFDSIYGQAEDFESMPPLPFNAIQNTLDDFNKF